MNVLIATEPDDTHAMLVKLALERKNHSCFLWYLADFPTQQTNSVYCSNSHHSWTTNSIYGLSKKIEPEQLDVVWWRRPRRPYISENSHKNDLEFIRKENHIFYESIPLEMAKGPWWINPYDSIKYASSKIYQLKLAVKTGFKIPDSLISNSPEDIKRFIGSHEDEEVIYKGFGSHYWYEHNQLRLSYTKPVTVNDLPDDQILQLTPGIFQKKLQKKYELRVTCFGDYIVAVKIDSQKHPEGQMDWRQIRPGILPIKPYILPESIEHTIRVFMRKLGVVFGCFDFIVTPDNDIHFLEINQQGQFLWIEKLLPEIPMLDVFVRFILEKTNRFQWEPNGRIIRMTDLELEAEKIIREKINNHIYLNGVRNTG
ncbi:hypothetical protein [Legionella spiritensis]|uniref:ATP-grasp domain-containing protein n=1 Tax=Legionella spiritensis TaxID=452 RepID=A0A0W0YXS9_LEGSP|nr:hypothetical protein [Legionella spiritensis]KTD61696.1 hypothetical protein Lspi_2326 [Legionella spiritensis]SNV38894.1 Glutathione synthase/Ribosomal protein S6 modification enzyme (glutaminyl transferase) [Legionella spiritensis]